MVTENPEPFFTDAEHAYFRAWLERNRIPYRRYQDVELPPFRQELCQQEIPAKGQE